MGGLLLTALTTEISRQHDSINRSSFPFPLQLRMIALFTQSCDDHIMKTSEKLNHFMNNMSKIHSIVSLGSSNQLSNHGEIKPFSRYNCCCDNNKEMLKYIVGWDDLSVVRFNQTHDQCKVWANLFPHSTGWAQSCMVCRVEPPWYLSHHLEELGLDLSFNSKPLLWLWSNMIAN